MLTLARALSSTLAASSRVTPLPSAFTLVRAFPLRRAFGSSSALLKQNLTLYTKDGCGLCDNAKKVLEGVFANGGVKFPVEYTQVDITQPENAEWWDKYCFDIPVVHITKEGADKPIKFMHYLFEDKIVEALNLEK